MFKIPEYNLNSFFRTYWRWFKNPEDVKGVDEAVYFSYEKVDVDGFRIKKGVTTAVGLSISEDEIYQGMRKKFIRKQITRGFSRGISVREGSYKELVPLYKSFRNKKHLGKVNIKEAAKVGTILLAECEGRVVAGGLFLSDGEHVRAHVLVSVRLSGKDQVEVIGYANRILLWEAIKFFKNQGCKKFDFGGINIKSKKREDISLAEFKEAFGGERIDCFYYHKIYSPLLKVIYRLRNYLHI